MATITRNGLADCKPTPDYIGTISGKVIKIMRSKSKQIRHVRVVRHSWAIVEFDVKSWQEKMDDLHAQGLKTIEAAKKLRRALNGGAV